MRAKSLSDRNVWIVVFVAAVVMLLTIPVAMVFGVRFTYTLRTVTFGGFILGAMSGAVGSFAVLRKQSLLGDALSHAALPGVGIAFLLVGRQLEALLIGAAVASLIGVWFISLITRTTRIKQDSAMGIVLAGWFAIGIGVLAFIQQRPDASQAGLDSFIFGQAAAVVQRDVRLLGYVTAGLFVVLVVNWKEFKLVTFDPEFARANGFRVGIITSALLGLIVVAVVMGLQLAGVILMVGLLIAPGIAARQLTNRLEQMVILAGLIGATSGGVGAVVSALDTDLPTGPMIILTASVFVLLSLLFAPGRGIVWDLLRRRNDQKRFAAANVLKTAHQHALGHGDLSFVTSEAILIGLVGKRAKDGIRQLRDSGYLEARDNGYALTESGVVRAESETPGGDDAGS